MNKNEILFNLIEISTYQRIIKIYKNESLFLRLLWAACYLISFSCCSFIIIQSFIDFFKYDVSINFSILSDNTFEFPSITICNLNRIDYSINGAKTEILNYLKSLNKYNYTHLNDSRTIPTDLDIFEFVNSIEADLQNMPNSKLMKLLNNYGYTAESMIINCYFNTKPCYYDSFYYNNLTKKGKKYGKCYIFNSGFASNGSKTPLVELTKPGLPYGLQLKLFVGKPDLQPFWVTNLGAIISVNNNGDTFLMIEEGVSIRPGDETNLILNRQVLKRLPKPYSNCIANVSSRNELNSAYFNNTFAQSNNYRQKVCINECTKADKYNLSISSKTYAECLENCPQECVSTQFIISTFMSAYPSDEYANVILNQYNQNKSEKNKLANIEELKKSILSLNIYFDKKEYTEIAEKPLVTFDILLANLGGQLGLFLGLDVLSLVELFEFVFIANLLVFGKVSQKSDNKIKNTNN